MRHDGSIPNVLAETDAGDTDTWLKCELLICVLLNVKLMRIIQLNMFLINLSLI